MNNNSKIMIMMNGGVWWYIIETKIDFVFINGMYIDAILLKSRSPSP